MVVAFLLTVVTSLEPMVEVWVLMTVTAFGVDVLVEVTVLPTTVV